MMKIRIQILFILLLTAISGCKVNYSFTGGNIDPKIKTISILFFPNNATIVQPTLSQSFTEALRDKFSSQTKLLMISKGGDLNIEGSITGYSVQPVAIQGNETAAMNRLTITVSVKFTNKLDEKQNFEQAFSRFEDYLSSQNLSAVEATLIKDINEALVEDIFNKAVVNW
jgi:hypothetical protein